jgi:hypothetical protein
MAEYQIVCVDRVAGHGHITHVGISGLPGVWTVAQVRGCISRGNAFYTVSPSTREVAGVEPYDVIELDQAIETIRSVAGAVQDNHLDNLQACRMR